MESPEIPFAGGGPQVLPEMMDPWVQQIDRVPLALAISLYTKPIYYLDGFTLVPGSYKIRVAAWFNVTTGETIIGCRGTSIGAVDGGKDLADDKILALDGTDYCNLSIVNLAMELVRFLNDKTTGFIFAGHSLGGTAAFCMGERIQTARVVCFNPGAAPTNPVTIGPGPGRARVYHIFGDIISSHMGNSAAEVIRIKKQGVAFASSDAHSTAQLVNGRPFSIATAQEEENAFQKWRKRWFNFFSRATNYASYIGLGVKHTVYAIPGTVQ